MKPFLVHVHLYYKDLWPELKSCILNLADYKFVLYVTLVEPDEYIESDIKKSFSNSKVIIVKNVGYDIYPFIKVLNLNKLTDFSYVIKLHSKRNVKNINPFVWYAGARWRKYLLSFIGNKSTFNKTIDNLERNPSIGMHGANECITNRFTDEKRAQRAFLSFLESKGLKRRKFNFVAGSIFIVRAPIMQSLKDLNLSSEDFELPDLQHESCHIAHLLERFCGYIVNSQEYQIMDCTLSPLFSKCFLHLINMRKILMSFLFSVRITNSNKLNVKICKIPILNKKLSSK